MNVIVNIWKPNYKFKYLQGHISLSILDSETSAYHLQISWCPKDEDDITHLNPVCPPELLENLTHDEEWESHEVDLQYAIEGLNAQAILDWWQTFLESDPDYNLYTVNCSTVVYWALKQGGVSDRLSPQMRQQFDSVSLWTPWLIYQVVRGAGQCIKGDAWELLYPTNQKTSQMPSMCWHHGFFHVALQSHHQSHHQSHDQTNNLTNHSTHEVMVMSSPDAVIWGYPVQLGQTIAGSPSLCSWQDNLYIALRTHDDGQDNSQGNSQGNSQDNSQDNGQLYICASTSVNPDASTSWGDCIPIPGAYAGSSPSLCVHGDRLSVAYQSADKSHDVIVTTSTDGIQWNSGMNLGQASIGTPSICSFRGTLYIAFQGDEHHQLLVCAALDQDGPQWGEPILIGDEPIGGTPTLCVHRDRLYLAYQSCHPNHKILMRSSQDGLHWSDAQHMMISAMDNVALSSVLQDICLTFRASDPQEQVMLASYSQIP
ncbi:MAG: hypothetical protein AB4042_04925 [Leptolyngbyaceae cyanobacterium]